MAAARFHDRQNVPPQTRYYLLENDLWVSIGFPEPSVPAEAAAYKDTLPGAYEDNTTFLMTCPHPHGFWLRYVVRPSACTNLPICM